MCLKGFKEVQELLSAIEENGGTVVPVEDQDCTHLVILRASRGWRERHQTFVWGKS